MIPKVDHKLFKLAGKSLPIHDKEKNFWSSLASRMENEESSGGYDYYTPGENPDTGIPENTEQETRGSR